MAIKTAKEIMDAFKGILGDNTSDEALALTEDLNDTLNNINNDTTDWKKRYEDNDKEWRQKYRDRFFNGPAKSDDDEPDTDSQEETKPLTFESLFKEE